MNSAKIEQAMMISMCMILAKQTGCFAPGCKFNFESTEMPASQARVLRAGVLLLFVRHNEADKTEPPALRVMDNSGG